MYRNTGQRWSMFLALSMAACLAVAGVVSSPAAAASPGAGEPGYASMHGYVSLTGIENVYKITQTMQVQPPPPVANDVVILLNGTHGYYRHYLDVAGGPYTFGPDNFACRTMGDFQWQAAKQLVIELLDEATNPNAKYTRVASVGVGHANDRYSVDPNGNAIGGTGASHNNGEILTELMGPDQKRALLARIDD